MTKVPREIIRQFIKDENLKTAEDVQNALKSLFAGTLQEILEAEMDTTLGYQKHDSENKKTTNRRNGYRKKKPSVPSSVRRKLPFLVTGMANLNR